MKKRFAEEQVIRSLREAEELGVTIDDVCRKKMITPTGRREAMACLIDRGVSKRASCRYLGFSRRVEGYELRQRHAVAGS
jgi:hypothetical protein